METNHCYCIITSSFWSTMLMVMQLQSQDNDALNTQRMNAMKLVIPLRFIPRKKRLQTMLWHHNARVNSHQRWKQTRFRVCFHLWCELTITMNATEWQVSWNSCVDISSKILFNSANFKSSDLVCPRDHNLPFLVRNSLQKYRKF